MKGQMSGLHPAASFAFFFYVTVFSVLLMHPVMLGLSLGGAAAYALFLDRGKAPGWFLCFILPVMVLTGVMNPLFNHRGVTVLFDLPSGNPVTLESILYGLLAGVMVAAVICWFFCFQRVITSEKIVYLTGRVFPSASLILTMALRFVPCFVRRLARIGQAGKWLCPRASGTGAGKAMDQFSILVSWALENAVETADSMKSRGYGLPGRTSFSPWRFDLRDGLFLAAATGLSLWVSLILAGGFLRWSYYPMLAGAALTPAGVSGLAAYGFLCFLPVLFEGREALRWRYMKSRI